MNALAARNRRRLQIAHARQHAPLHAVGIEARLVLALGKRLQVQLAAIKKRALDVARAGLRADERKRAPAQAPGSARLHQEVHAEARRAAEDVRKKVARALGVKVKDFDVDLSDEISHLTDRVMSIQTEYDALAGRRARETLREWQNLGERSPRLGDVDALDGMLDATADAVASKLQQSVRDAFGQAWAEMNQSAQLQAGVSQYVWVATLDATTRPEHRELDGEACDWSDPPLKGSKSSSGEDCHAGEDYGCRCTASPVSSN